MWTTSRRTSPGAAIAVLSLLMTCSGMVLAGNGGDILPPRLLVDAAPGGFLVLSAPDLGPADRVELGLPGAPAAERVPGGWTLDSRAGGPGSWKVVRDGSRGALRGQAVPVPVTGSPVLVSVYRSDPATGDQYQAHAWVELREDGTARLQPAGASRVRNMLRITLPEGAETAGLVPDGAGRVILRADDPRAEELRELAVAVEPFVQATPLETTTIEAVGTVTGTNTSDTYFTDRPCSGTWFGSVIDINTAPAGQEVVQADVDFTVYHSVDVSRFKSGLWHKVGGSWTDFVEVYSGQSSGGNWLNGMFSNIHAFDGSNPNTEYILASCNRFSVPEEAYLDEWTLTVYFTESSGSIDLVADSVSLEYSTVAAGGQVGYLYEAHVAGSGSVGTGFETGVYLSSDAVITTGDRLIQAVAEPSNLAAGDTYGTAIYSRQAIIPGDVAPGSYWVGILTDNGGVVAETDEGNNTAATPITVVSSASLPNLVTSDCSVAPSSANPGDTVTLTYRSRNTGGTGASYFTWATFISTDAAFDAGDQMVAGLDVVGGWAAGYDSGTTTVDIPLGSLPDGVYHVGFVVDPDDQVPETDETDNWCTAQVTVGSGGGGGSIMKWLIPAAASAPGLNESDWRTQVSIVNAGTTPATVNVYYVASGATYPGVLLSGPITLAPNQARYLDDPLAGLRPTAGLIYVVPEGGDVLVTSRTLNRKAGGERYGQGIPAIGVMVSHCEDELVLPLANTGPGQYHTNLGLVQMDDETYTVEVTLYSPGGTVLATKQYTQNIAYRQITDIFGDMGLSSDFNVEGAWIRVKLVDGCPDKWTTYASIVDDTTGDPSYIEPYTTGPVIYLSPGQ